MIWHFLLDWKITWIFAIIYSYFRSTLKKLPSSHSQKNNIFKKQSLIKIGLFCSELIMKQLLFVDDRKKNNSFILRSKFEVAKSQLFLKFACLRPFSTKMVPLFIDKLGFQKNDIAFLSFNIKINVLYFYFFIFNIEIWKFIIWFNCCKRWATDDSATYWYFVLEEESFWDRI